MAGEADFPLISGWTFQARTGTFVNEQISLGDFVMTGGEVAAMAVIEATARLLPGVLGNAESPVDESNEAGLLEYPQYTRPLVLAPPAASSEPRTVW